MWPRGLLQGDVMELIYRIIHGSESTRTPRKKAYLDAATGG
jgi:uncharacterized membrane-anchored protein